MFRSFQRFQRLLRFLCIRGIVRFIVDLDVVPTVGASSYTVFNYQIGKSRTTAFAAEYSSTKGWAAIGCSVQVPISGGRMMLGTWQAVFFCEFDGPRTRRCIVTVVGE